ncbi:MAG: (Fe-S)-binding protein [Chitinophagaceae bacterium]|nr:(Fe-S)-binding protein [Chitinophagaceae bacterium]
MRVQLFIPCFVDQLFPETAFNVVKLLEFAGCEVLYNTNQTCCGQPAFNAGFQDEAKIVCNKFLEDFNSGDYIVTPSASCAGFIKNYSNKLVLASDLPNANQSVNLKLFELSDFLVNVLKFTDFKVSFPVKATYHDSCAALRECKIKEEPRILLNKVDGLELLEMIDVETCCGFGGTFAVKFEAISTAMASQKVNNALAVGAEYIISTDVSCLMHLKAYAEKQNLPIKTLHIADVLANGL